MAENSIIKEFRVQLEAMEHKNADALEAMRQKHEADLKALLDENADILAQLSQLHGRVPTEGSQEHPKMSDNKNTLCLDTEGGGALSTGAANRNNEKPLTRSRSKKEVLKIVEKNKDIDEAQHAPPPSSGKTAEGKKKNDTPRKTLTSATKRRKISSEEVKEGYGSSRKAAKDTTKIKGKPKPKPKSNKKQGSKQKQGEAIQTYQPQYFVGLYVCKDDKGIKTLGTVNSYDATTKLYKIRYDDDEIRYMKQSEIFKTKANAKDIFDARQQLLQSSNESKETTEEEKE